MAQWTSKIGGPRGRQGLKAEGPKSLAGCAGAGSAGRVHGVTGRAGGGRNSGGGRGRRAAAWAAQGRAGGARAVRGAGRGQVETTVDSSGGPVAVEPFGGTAVAGWRAGVLPQDQQVAGRLAGAGCTRLRGERGRRAGGGLARVMGAGPGGWRGWQGRWAARGRRPSWESWVPCGPCRPCGRHAGRGAAQRRVCGGCSLCCRLCRGERADRRSFWFKTKSSTGPPDGPSPTSTGHLDHG